MYCRNYWIDMPGYEKDDSEEEGKVVKENKRCQAFLLAKEK